MAKSPLDDVDLRATIVMLAVISNPREIARFCRSTIAMSEESRMSIVRGIEIAERRRLGKKSRAA